MAQADNIIQVGDSIVKLQETNTDRQKVTKLGLSLSDAVASNQSFMLDTMRLQLQQKLIQQTNDWLGLQKDLEIRNIEKKTGQLVSAQTSAYGFSGVTMSGSAVDTELRQLKEGALEAIYVGISAGMTKANNDYQDALLGIQSKAAKRQQTAKTVSSVGRVVSSFVGGNK